MSSVESKYITGAEVVKEALFMGALIKELGYVNEGIHPVLLLINNQSAMKIANNPVNHPATKHIRMRYHMLRQVVSEIKDIRL